MTAESCVDAAGGRNRVLQIKRLRARYAPAGSFADSVLTVMTGTAVALAIPIAAAPVLTRLYSPADFGLFALYLSITHIVASVAGARYEVAIILPETDEAAANVAALAVLFALAVSTVSLLAVWLLNAPITRLLGTPAMSGWLYLAPLTVLLASVFQTLNFWAIRRNQFKSLALRKIAFSVTMVASQIGLGQAPAGLQSGGLIYGQIAGDALATGLLLWKVCRDDWSRFKGSIAWGAIKSMLGRYKDFPKYDIPSSLLNILSNQMPTLLFSAFFGPAVVGFYALTHRVLSIPVALLANSVLDVYKQRAALDYQKDGNCEAIYLRTFKTLAVLSFVPFSLFAAFAPALFAFAFGEEWRTAGEYGRIMAGFYFVQFIASPLSYTAFIAERQRLHMIWQIGLFIAITAALMRGVVAKSVTTALGSFAVAYVLLYVVSLYMTYRFARGTRRVVAS